MEVIFSLTPYDIEYLEQADCTRRPRSDAAGARRRGLDPRCRRRCVGRAVCPARDRSPLRRCPDPEATATRRFCGGVNTVFAAEKAGLGLVVTTSIDTGIGTAAALQLAAAVGDEHAHGLATLNLLEDDLILEELPIEAGYYSPARGARPRRQPR